MKSIIFGATGQDGSYLAEHLLDKDHEVIGVARRTSTPNTERLVDVLDHPLFKLVPGDITDFGSVSSIIQENPPDWIFNLAAQSHVGTSFGQACSSMDITAVGCVNILEALRQLDNIVGSKTKFYQASSSEMFGTAYNISPDFIGGQYAHKSYRYQDEKTKFQPQSPYAIAKVAAHNFCLLYRKAYNMDIRTGILFNHESERRGEEFVTRKITKWLGQFKGWLTCFSTQNPSFNDYNIIHPMSNCAFPKLRLGNLDVSRDWGHALDYVKAMTLIMEANEASDWVVATGKTHTIKDFLKLAFDLAGIGCWKEYIVIDESLKRPAEVPFLQGDSSRIREELGWEPEITFPKLVKVMVEHDITKYRVS